MQIWPGQPYPLGATFDGVGTNFSVFSESAARVELCLFDAEGHETGMDLPETTALCWHGYLPNVRPGQRYGFRVHGPWAPEQGHWFNPSKLLLDPYSKAVDGPWDWNEAMFPYHFADPDNSKNDLDSAPYVPKSVVINPYFDWGYDRRPNTPWHRTVVYETHVKGFTRTHPEIPEELRGTYAGMAHPVAVKYLTRLGITAVELLPVHQFVHDSTLVQRGLRNYWGYNSLGYLAPHNEYAASGQRGEQVQEFKHLVKTMHEAGIEVILDVVYNHTAEGNHLGPMLSFKGIDNAAYYRLVGDNRRFYTDYTGTGNTLNMRHPHVLQLMMDSLRYWVLDMHVDGFRFDLAATLARELHEVDRLSAFFDLIQQDPVVSQVKLIAEPWDVGEGGYQVGNFPPLWSEWNGKYRDTARDFWRGADQALAQFAYRFTGSSDLYEGSGRKPYASLNFVTAHDGFTLRDLVSYNDKHNEANGEENRDGESYNRSWNCGEEGPTGNPEVLALRARQSRNFLATLLLSQGVPMLLGGDEIGRTARGNNNAYCQDNEMSWYDWAAADQSLLRFARRLIRMRLRHPVFCRRRWFQGRAIHGTDVGDIGWFTPAGHEMSDEDWQAGFAKSLGVFLNGRAIPTPNERGERIVDESFYVMFNAHQEPLDFTLPEAKWGTEWGTILDTTAEDAHYMREDDIARSLHPGEICQVQPWSLVLLRRIGAQEEVTPAAPPTSQS
ncbi:MAG: glycogen debranching enzyme GlgX [Acidobacteria bacterium RIFCSPLOWO2_02_FULL_67_36]|nr:MAG: glycogen debranching enzyme GlgX [Acidobacteria bacterium RIFCSPLOWO2_02_FULL_67_36]OFW24401.1 MAG: glycogen debranching enzyme GlgX [Acidobacteria bacterium RIFCSPLOWO2_12_FULL_66_21]